MAASLLRRTADRPKVLVLSRSYPNNKLNLLGLWVECLVTHSIEFCEPKVISPVPWCPPLPGIPERFARFREIERRTSRNGVESFYPRFFTGPGYSLFRHEAYFYRASVQRLADRMRSGFPFDLIHANFSYPDGVVAVELGRRYNVPVVITEHVPWNVWNNHVSVRNRAVQAARECACHISVSTSARDSVSQYTGRSANLAVIPNGVDGSVFTLPPDGHKRIAGQILFAGAVRPVKGVDILLRAVRNLLVQGRAVQLVIAGEAYYGKYRMEEERLRGMVLDLGLSANVTFVGKKMPEELARYMQDSAMLVLPSRAESFGMVLVEALACGTPVVATRCGGPEDIVTADTGVLVPVEDAEGLASGIAQVLDAGHRYNPFQLREYALRNFSLESVGAKLAAVYGRVLSRTDWSAQSAEKVNG